MTSCYTNVTTVRSARVPSKACYVRTETGLRCTARQAVATHIHTKKVSLSKTGPRPTAAGCAMFACAYRACPHADGQAASTQPRLHCAVRRESTEAHSGCQLRRCNEAPRSSAKKLAAEIAGANILERARRGRCCREERKAVCTRHGEPARARPRPHARLGFGAGRRERGRFPRRCFACRLLHRQAHKADAGKNREAALRKSTANRKKLIAFCQFHGQH